MNLSTKFRQNPLVTFCVIHVTTYRKWSFIRGSLNWTPIFTKMLSVGPYNTPNLSTKFHQNPSVTFCVIQVTCISGLSLEVLLIGPRSSPKFNQLVLMTLWTMPTNFHQNPLVSFCVILFTDRQTDRQTDKQTDRQGWKHNLQPTSLVLPDNHSTQNDPQIHIRIHPTGFYAS